MLGGEALRVLMDFSHVMLMLCVAFSLEAQVYLAMERLKVSPH